VSGETELEHGNCRAMRAGRRIAACEPRARAALFDAVTGRLVVDLANGATSAVPVSQLQGLANASADDLAQVEVVPGGGALYWEALNVGFGVPGLLRGEFGTSTWMRALGGRADSRASPAAAKRHDDGKRDRARRAVG
jgi:hypothetical protein